MNKNQDERMIYTRLDGPGKELASILLSSAYQEASALFHQEVKKEEKEANRYVASPDTDTEKNNNPLPRQRNHKKAKWGKNRICWILAVIFGLVLTLIISTLQPRRSAHREAESVPQTEAVSEAVSPAKEPQSEAPEKISEGN